MPDLLIASSILEEDYSLLLKNAVNRIYIYILFLAAPVPILPRPTTTSHPNVVYFVESDEETSDKDKTNP